jgi:hypothetical protein
MEEASRAKKTAHETGLNYAGDLIVVSSLTVIG